MLPHENPEGKASGRQWAILYWESFASSRREHSPLSYHENDDTKINVGQTSLALHLSPAGDKGQYGGAANSQVGWKKHRRGD